MIHSSVGGQTKTVTTPFKAGTWPLTFSGSGIAITGTVNDIRQHTIQDSNNKYHRYLVVEVDIEEARNRIFNEKGQDVDATYETEKTFAKGYLNKFDHRDDDPNRLTIDQVLSRLGGKALPNGVYDEQQPRLHPHVKNRFEFWGEVNMMKPFDIKKGSKIKLKTKNDSFFVESCGNIQGTTNYSGENVIGGWTSKIGTSGTAKVEEKSHKPLPGEDKEGVDESEWDD